MWVLFIVLVIVFVCYEQRRAKAAQREKAEAARLFIDRAVADGTVYPVYGHWGGPNGRVEGSADRLAAQLAVETREAAALIYTELSHRGIPRIPPP